MSLFPARTTPSTAPPRLLPRVLTGTITAALGASALAVAGPAPAASATPTAAVSSPSDSSAVLRARHPGRRIVGYVVRRGDTPSSIAVRFHAWTAELISLNGLHRPRDLRAGSRIRVPVVIAAARGTARSHSRPHRARQHTRKPLRHGWRHADLTRKQVRRVIARRARIHGVPPKLALAVAWQESGWRQPLISSDGAVGVMQLLPSTGRWMSHYAQRHLWIRDTHDNVSGGLLLLKQLREETGRDRRAIAAYYQGLGALRDHGLYRETKRYVRSVEAIRRQLQRTGQPW